MKKIFMLVVAALLITLTPAQAYSQADTAAPMSATGPCMGC